MANVASDPGQRDRLWWMTVYDKVLKNARRRVVCTQTSSIDYLGRTKLIAAPFFYLRRETCSLRERHLRNDRAQCRERTRGSGTSRGLLTSSLTFSRQFGIVMFQRYIRKQASVYEKRVPRGNLTPQWVSNFRTEGVLRTRSCIIGKIESS